MDEEDKKNAIAIFIFGCIICFIVLWLLGFG
jgi:hypothetical protein